MRANKYTNNVWCAECGKWTKKHMLEPNQIRCKECGKKFRVTPITRADKEKCYAYTGKVRY